MMKGEKMEQIKRPRGRPRKEPTISQHYRLPLRLVTLATKKAKSLCMKLPEYISMLIAKDNDTP